ncbi:hypothetical protein CK203_025650 [Vitis vinifera]|uniref:Uncharacterized protein n=1 Tax=Vitis vinifera TaxID=29760 RepID=A0A438IEH6_VITVI|nr:hypothetical protein CK203_025650 [Vitis vinifera]
MEVEEEEGRENGLVITEEEVDVEVEEEEERQMGQENWFLVIKEEEEEEEAEEETGLLSAEELNKKCDDFIKKMREGIKFEAQQLTNEDTLGLEGISSNLKGMFGLHNEVPNFHSLDHGRKRYKKPDLHSDGQQNNAKI